MNWKFWKSAPSTEQAPKKKTVVREWFDAILFAVVAATLIRWLIMEAYTIPTPSMENSMLVGDFLFVSKFHYGTRTPQTPLQLPLTHQKIWFTEIPSYLDWIKLPYYRLPGFSSVKRSDVVVFNVPDKGENGGIDYPVDLKTNYIKRCMGLPGDELTIKDTQVFANGSAVENPPNMELRYLVFSKDEINQRNLENLGLDPDDYQYTGRTPEYYASYVMFLTKDMVGELKSLPYVVDVTQDYRGQGPDPQIFPASRRDKWNADNYGPLIIPKKGMTIAVNDSTLGIYGQTIALYDHNDEVEIRDGKLMVNGAEVSEYTFNQNYYFMMGDNRHNSRDSRYWGFVPEDHIVGKGFFIWLSIDKYGSWFGKIRWSRFFNLVR